MIKLSDQVVGRRFAIGEIRYKLLDELWVYGAKDTQKGKNVTLLILLPEYSRERFDSFLDYLYKYDISEIESAHHLYKNKNYFYVAINLDNRQYLEEVFQNWLNGKPVSKQASKPDKPSVDAKKIATVLGDEHDVKKLRKQGDTAEKIKFMSFGAIGALVVLVLILSFASPYLIRVFTPSATLTQTLQPTETITATATDIPTSAHTAAITATETPSPTSTITPIASGTPLPTLTPSLLPVTFADDFSDLEKTKEQWILASGTWDSTQGFFTCQKQDSSCVSFENQGITSDFVVSVDFRGDFATDKAVYLGYIENQKNIEVLIQSDPINEIKVIRHVVGQEDIVLAQFDFDSKNNNWYRLNITVVENSFKIKVNDQQILNLAINTPSDWFGQIGLGIPSSSDNGSVASFDNFFVSIIEEPPPIEPIDIATPKK